MTCFATKSRPFTDRRNLLEDFERNVLNNTNSKVLMYYGIPGIGKSSLKKEILSLINYNSRSNIQVSLDFQNPSYCNLETTVYMLGRILNTKYNIEFPKFNYAYNLYWKKAHPQTSLVENKLVSENKRTFVEVFALAEEIPVIGVIPKSLNFLDSLGKKVSSWRIKKGNPSLADLESMEAKEILDKLPAIFALDLEQYLHENKNRIFCVLDSFEILRMSQRQYSDDGFEDWVKELINCTPMISWIIFGQERLRWADSNDIWQKKISQHHVEAFNHDDATNFLLECGIIGEEIRKAMAIASECVPFYLDVLVDTYFNVESNTGRPPENRDIAKTPPEVCAKFFRYLTVSEAETMKVLSITRGWDEALFISLVRHFNTGYPSTAYTRIAKFSFINVTEEFFYMHDLMRKCLKENISSTLEQEVDDYLFGYYNNLICKTAHPSNADVNARFILEAFHHGKKSMNSEDVVIWFDAQLSIIHNMEQPRILIPIWEEYIQFLEEVINPQDLYLPLAINRLAALYISIGDFKRSDQLSLTSLEKCINIAGFGNWACSRPHSTLAKSYKEQGKFEQAETEYIAAIDIIRSTLLDSEYAGEILKEKLSLGDMLNDLGVLYTEIGRYSEAERCICEGLELRTQILRPNDKKLIYSKNDLANLYSFMDNYEKAEQLFEELLECVKKEFEKDHPFWGTLYNNVAVLYHCKKDYEKAESYLRQSIDSLLLTREEEHPFLARTYCSLGCILTLAGKYEEAKTILLKSLKIRKEHYGDDHSETAASLCFLGRLFRMQGIYVEAQPYYQEAMRITLLNFSISKPALQILFECGNYYYSIYKFDKANEAFLGALKIVQSSEGAVNCVEIQILNNLGASYNKLGEFEKALDKYQEAFKFTSEILGSDSVDAAVSLNGIACYYTYKEDYETAISYYQKAINLLEKNKQIESQFGGTILNSLGVAYSDQKKYDEAEEYIGCALAIRKKVLSPEHCEIGDSLQSIAIIYINQGKYYLAEKPLEETLKLYKNAFPPNHHQIVSTLKLLIDVAKRMGNTKKANFLKAVLMKSFKKG